MHLWFKKQINVTEKAQPVAELLPAFILMSEPERDREISRVGLVNPRRYNVQASLFKDICEYAKKHETAKIRLTDLERIIDANRLKELPQLFLWLEEQGYGTISQEIIYNSEKTDLEYHDQLVLSECYEFNFIEAMLKKTILNDFTSSNNMFKRITDLEIVKKALFSANLNDYYLKITERMISTKTLTVLQNKPGKIFLLNVGSFTNIPVPQELLMFLPSFAEIIIEKNIYANEKLMDEVLKKLNWLRKDFDRLISDNKRQNLAKVAEVILTNRIDIASLSGINKVSDKLFVCCLIFRNFVQNEENNKQLDKQIVEALQKIIESILNNVAKANKPISPTELSNYIKKVSASVKIIESNKQRFQSLFTELALGKEVIGNKKVGIPKLNLLHKNYIHRDNLYDEFIAELEETKLYMSYLLRKVALLAIKQNELGVFAKAPDLAGFLLKELKNSRPLMHEFLQKNFIVAESIRISLKNQDIETSESKIRSVIDQYFKPDSFEFRNILVLLEIEPQEIFKKAIEFTPAWSQFIIFITGKSHRLISELDSIYGTLIKPKQATTGNNFLSSIKALLGMNIDNDQHNAVNNTTKIVSSQRTDYTEHRRRLADLNDKKQVAKKAPAPNPIKYYTKEEEEEAWMKLRDKLNNH